VSLRFSWLVPLSTGITVGIVYVAAIASKARGWPLFRLLALLYGGVGVMNINVENLVFRIMRPEEVTRVAATGLMAATAVSAALTWGRMRDEPRPQSIRDGLTGQLWWRVPLLGAACIVLFLTAGSLILPFVRQFYSESGLITMPSFGFSF